MKTTVFAERALRRLNFPGAEGGKYLGKCLQNWLLPLGLGHGTSPASQFINLPSEESFKYGK